MHIKRCNCYIRTLFVAFTIRTSNIVNFEIMSIQCENSEIIERSEIDSMSLKDLTGEKSSGVAHLYAENYRGQATGSGEKHTEKSTHRKQHNGKTINFNCSDKNISIEFKGKRKIVIYSSPYLEEKEIGRGRSVSRDQSRCSRRRSRGRSRGHSRGHSRRRHCKTQSKSGQAYKIRQDKNAFDKCYQERKDYSSRGRPRRRSRSRSRECSRSRSRGFSRGSSPNYLEIVSSEYSNSEQEGYLSIVAYIHYFKPGLLKIHTNVRSVQIAVLQNVLEESIFDRDVLKATRRWLQKGEIPYPGYCRKPGSDICQPVLCNCDKLTEIWEKMKSLNKTNC